MRVAKEADEAMLIAVADATCARIFVRRRPGDPLEELPLPSPAVSVVKKSASLGQVSEDSEVPRGSPAHVFLQETAAWIDEAAIQNHASSLVLFAAPHALCALRDGLDDATRQLLARELPRNLAHEPMAVIEASLRQRQL